MTPEQLRSLRQGDIIRHVHDADALQVIQDFDGRSATAIRVTTVTQANEWILVYKAEYKDPNEE